MAPYLSTLKKRSKSKRPIQGNLDPFKGLPDELIIYILGFLELKDVAKSSVLAKRWNLLWTKVDTIVINFHFEPDLCISPNLRRKQAKTHFSSLNKTLTNFSRIRNFSITGNFDSFDYGFPDIVNKWVQYALDSNVETMNLDYNGLSTYAPHSVFQSLSLTQLEISKGFYNCAPVNLPLLKTLSLSDIIFGYGVLEEILDGCPVLETLVLKGAICLNIMRIISPSLKKVKLIDVTCEGLRNEVRLLEIRAPLLKELEIGGYFLAAKCVLAGLYSLVKARLMFTICPPNLKFSYTYGYDSRDWIRMVEELLKSLCDVGDLVIGGNLLQVLTILMSRKSSLTFMCKQLRTVSPLRNYDLPGIIYLLGSAPYLEGLIVEVYYPEDISLIDQVKEALSVNLVLHKLSYAKGEFINLKTVVIEYQRSPCVDCPPPHHSQVVEKCLDFELVDYILRSCVALERLALRSRKDCCNETKCLKPDCAFQHVNQLSSKLSMHSLPRSEWKLTNGEINERKFVFAYTFPKHTSMPFEDSMQV